MRRFLIPGICVMIWALPFAARAAARPEKTPFQQYNPDIDKFAFARSFIASLSYYGRLDQRLNAELAMGDKYDRDLGVIQSLIDGRTLDNTELRVAKNYFVKYLPSKNILIRKVASGAIMAYEQHILVSSRERQLWQAYLKFKQMGAGNNLNEAEFSKQMERLARDRKSAAMSVLNTVVLFKNVLLSAARCVTEDCRELALTQAERDKLVQKLDDFAEDNMEWGLKSGQRTFEAAIASVREVLEDPVYVSRK